jgi:hypothetical protein
MSSHFPAALKVRKKLLEFLNEQGFPIGESTFEKLCSPAIGQGPPVAGWWGRRPLYDPEVALAWARRRVRWSDSTEGAESATSRGPAYNAQPKRRGRPRKIIPAQPEQTAI